ncbi:MAG: hypothetical protein WDM92_03620 [Caulobacteraceae bacterium]
MHLDPWTLALQAANFLVLVWLLQRFLYRPVLAIIATRQDAANKLTADLEAQKAAAASARADLDQQRAGLAEERERTLRAARDAADAERKALLDAARAQADAIRAQAQTAFEHERADAVQAIGQDAARLAVAVVRRLLREPEAAAVEAPLLGLALQDLQAMPEDARRQIGQRLDGQDRPLEVVTAAPLAPPAAAQFSKDLAAALGAPAEPAFRVDPDLLAGRGAAFPVHDPAPHLGGGPQAHRSGADP